MSTWYVYDGGDNDPGYGPTDRDDPSQSDNWTNAFQLIDTAEAAMSDGDVCYVASDHSESTTVLTLALAFSIGNKPQFISIDRASGLFETMVDGGGSIATSSGDINLQGKGYFNGLTFIANDDIYLAALNDASLVFDNCKLQANDNFVLSQSANTVSIITMNCNFIIATSGIFNISENNFVMFGGSISSLEAMTNTVLFNASVEGANINLHSVDLSGVYVNTSLILANTDRSDITLERCKMWSGWGVLDQDRPAVGTIKCHACDSGDGYWHFLEVSFYGRVYQATNCYLNATYDGTNGFSSKMESSANAKEYAEPLRFKLSEFYAAANPTLTVEVIGTASLQDDEFWVEVEYSDATDEAFGKIVDTKPATITTTPSNLTTSTAAWTEDLSGEVKQKVAVSISGGAAGMHTVWVCLAKPSTTIYVDPDVVVS